MLIHVHYVDHVEGRHGMLTFCSPCGTTAFAPCRCCFSKYCLLIERKRKGNLCYSWFGGRSLFLLDQVDTISGLNFSEAMWHIWDGILWDMSLIQQSWISAQFSRLPKHFFTTGKLTLISLHGRTKHTEQPRKGHLTVAIKSPQRKGITAEYHVTAAGVSCCLSRLRHMLCSHYNMDLNDNEIFFPENWSWNSLWILTLNLILDIITIVPILIIRKQNDITAKWIL